MGPRLLGRGNYVMAKSERPDLVKLQWGRVCWDAEIGLGKTFIASHIALQWGRVCWDAEISRQHPDGRDLGGASMGPRLLGRGNVWACWAAGVLKCCFNGAASVGTRKCPSTEGSLSGVGRFNGAASVGTRKYRQGRLLQNGDAGFNGAASVGTRKYTETPVVVEREAASMGPRLLGRGNPGAGGIGHLRRVASMGPRLLGRGNGLSHRGAGLVGRLQWGRVCWDAEIDSA